MYRCTELVTAVARCGSAQPFPSATHRKEENFETRVKKNGEEAAEISSVSLELILLLFPSLPFTTDSENRSARLLARSLARPASSPSHMVPVGVPRATPTPAEKN